MRPLLIVGIVLTLAGSGFAASSAPVQYALAFNKPVQLIGPDGVFRILRVTGAVGGIAVTGEYNDVEWRVGPSVAPGSTLADGKFACTGTTCTLLISTLLDQSVGIQGPSFTFGQTVSGPIPGFATRREWVSAVSRWAESNVDPGLRDKIVSQAAGVQAGDGH